VTEIGRACADFAATLAGLLAGPAKLLNDDDFPTTHTLEALDFREFVRLRELRMQPKTVVTLGTRRSPALAGFNEHQITIHQMLIRNGSPSRDSQYSVTSLPGVGSGFQGLRAVSHGADRSRQLRMRGISSFDEDSAGSAS
jgi:hypothetical protein